MSVRLEGKELALTATHTHPGGGFVLKVYDSVDTALKNWGASTRCSPIYPFNHAVWPTNAREVTVWFLGPHFPGSLPDGVPAYLSLGMYNVLLVASKKAEREKAQEYVDSLKQTPWERWTMGSKGLVTDISYAPIIRSSACASQDGGQIKLPQGLRSAAEEYRTLIAATIAKANAYRSDVSQDLRNFDEIFRKNLESTRSRPVTKSQWLVNVNAALSRFSSQAFAGISPITSTECHYWTHSLLGVGLGAQALIAIRNQALKAFAQADFRRRLHALESVAPNPVKLTKLRLGDGFWQSHHLTEKIDEREHHQISPIVCFSGRDGFRSTTLTLSVPLEVLSSSNTLGWTLRTITHEISHLFVDAILNTLLPNIDDVAEAEHLLETLDKSKPNNLFEQLQQYLCFSIFKLASDEKAKSIQVHSGEELTRAVEDTYQEVSEVLTHIFDFLYFYGRNRAIYVPAIWGSWDVIPNIASRIDEYLMRTLCAVMTQNLSAPDPFEVTITQVLEEMENLSNVLQDANIVARAAEKLRNDRAHFRSALMQHTELVLLSYSFLYSPAIAQMMNRSHVQSKKSGFDFKPNIFERDVVVTNPLRFIFDQAARYTVRGYPGLSQVSLDDGPDRFYEAGRWPIVKLSPDSFKDSTKARAFRDVLLGKKEVSGWSNLIEGEWYQFVWDNANESVPFVLRDGRDRFLLLAHDHTLVSQFLDFTGLVSVARKPRIAVSQFVKDSVAPVNAPNQSFARQYRLSNIFGAVDGYGRSLQTVALWGDDLLSAELFLKVLDEINPYRVTVRDMVRNVDVASIGSLGEVNFFFGSQSSLRRVDTFFRHLKRGGYLRWNNSSSPETEDEDVSQEEP